MIKFHAVGQDKYTEFLYYGRMEHLGWNKNPFRKLGQNVREKTRKNISYYISGYEILGISMKKAGIGEDG